MANVKSSANGQRQNADDADDEYVIMTMKMRNMMRMMRKPIGVTPQD